MCLEVKKINNPACYREGFYRGALEYRNYTQILSSTRPTSQNSRSTELTRNTHLHLERIYLRRATKMTNRWIPKHPGSTTKRESELEKERPELTEIAKPRRRCAVPHLTADAGRRRCEHENTYDRSGSRHEPPRKRKCVL
jgi:hypothetical protein